MAFEQASEEDTDTRHMHKAGGRKFRHREKHVQGPEVETFLTYF